MIRYTQNLPRVQGELPHIEAPPLQPVPIVQTRARRFYRKKELVTEGAKKGVLRTGQLPISRATFDRWRAQYSDFAINYNPNPNGWGMYDLDEILEWMRKNGR